MCTGVSLILGLAIAGLCMYKSRYSQSFVVTLAMLPAVVELVIMLVNGNIGAGVAVAGTFGLVRFRSVAGTAREIGMIFLAMAIGLATGMGYVALAVLFFCIMAAFSLILSAVRFGGGNANERDLKITIPESLDYDGLFNDLFQKYTASAELERVKTSNMGTMYELDYKIVLKGSSVPKEFLDALRCRNSNLNIVCGRPVTKESL
ncbi:DUF4956 domain-containing protein [Dysosmobacter sp.]|uniref:DUF4956 domain-containing protein n=1 Tax=Dysosmobacter sp. TaxID=2591382 RepID=UPI003FA45EBD